MLFFADRRSQAAAPVAGACGMDHEHIEYLMEAMPAEVSLSTAIPEVSLRPATYADLAFMARLDEEGFGVQAWAAGTPGWNEPWMTQKTCGCGRHSQPMQLHGRLTNRPHFDVRLRPHRCLWPVRGRATGRLRRQKRCGKCGRSATRSSSWK